MKNDHVIFWGLVAYLGLAVGLPALCCLASWLICGKAMSWPAFIIFVAGSIAWVIGCCPSDFD